MVLVAERLERGSVNSRVSAFPEVFGIAERRVDRKMRRVGVNHGFDGD